MLRTFALFIVLSAIWLLLAAPVATPEQVLIAAGAAALCVGLAARLGGVTMAFGRSPRLWLARLGKLVHSIGDASVVARGAFRTRTMLEPGLVRVHARYASKDDREAFADLISMRPGLIVVDADSEGLLAHALSESEVDEADFARAGDAVSGRRSQ